MGSINPFSAPTVTSTFTGLPMLIKTTVENTMKMEMSKRAVLGMLLSHMTEHFGQLTAYARVNGIVPPWILEAKKKAAEKKDAEKKDAK